MTGATRRTLDSILDAMLDAFPSSGRELVRLRGSGRRPLPRRAAPPGRRTPPPPGRASRSWPPPTGGGGRPRPSRPGPGRGGAAAGPGAGRATRCGQVRVLGVTSYLEGPAATAAERAAGLRRHLEQVPRRPRPADFAELVRVRTGSALDPARLLAKGQAEADRQLAAQREAAARAGGTPAEVRARAAKRAPAAGELLDAARASVAECRQFVVDSGFMTLPGDQPPEVEAAPPYLRGPGLPPRPGPFDPVPPSSFRYYLTPPRPEWDQEREGRWLACSSRILAVCSLHETYLATTPTSSTCATPHPGRQGPVERDPRRGRLGPLLRGGRLRRRLPRRPRGRGRRCAPTPWSMTRLLQLHPGQAGDPRPPGAGRRRPARLP